MKLVLQLSLVLTVAFSAMTYAQTYEGIATYKTQRKMDVQLDSSQVDDGMRDQIMAMMKKQFEKEYTLKFTQDESLYTEVEKLDNPGGAMGNGMVFEVQIVGDGAGDVLYKNTKEDRFVNQNESFSKQFLIKDKIEARAWKMEKETKNIGDYACFKATYTYERPVRRVMSFSTSNDKEEKEDKKDTKEEPVEEMETITVTAWYTPQIPVKNGPSQYDGLPGLILELNDGDLTVLCSKVVLNPKDDLNIKEPKGGKVVTQEKFDEIMEKKVQEMQERFESDGRRGSDNGNFEIRIGG